MFLTTRGLVLREAKYKESDKILTILTAEEGKLTVKARGVARTRSKDIRGHAALRLCRVHPLRQPRHVDGERGREHRASSAR